MKTVGERGKQKFLGDEGNAADATPPHSPECVQPRREAVDLTIFKTDIALRRLMLVGRGNAQFDFRRLFVPCNGNGLNDCSPSAQFRFYQRIANLLGSIGGNSGQFENGGECFRRGVLDFASRIGVGALYADMPCKLQNGFLDF
jgi:hypothetical protein